MSMSNIIIIGGGASGMLAAIIAGRRGHHVTILEKNEKLGKKLFITGKGRCNLTNACDADTFFNNIMNGRKFMYSSFHGFTNEQTISFFEELGLKTKVERGGRVFPQSDKSSDVIRVLQQEIKRPEYRIDIRLNTEVKSILNMNQEVKGVMLKNNMKLQADAVIIATGGCSYRACGTTGDGYRFAKESGHTIIACQSALVPFETKEPYPQMLQGLSLKNVNAKLMYQDKKIYEEMGEMLFTHFGVSGPLVLTASSFVKPDMYGADLHMIIDLKPALDTQQLDSRILRDFADNQNKQFRNSLGKLLPSKLIPIIIRLSGIDENKRVNEITKEERGNLVQLLKNLTLTITANRGYDEAIITRGGISLKEVNPKTMESKLVKGLYFTGEVLDIDALTGGFNLQIAWSTAYAAGSAIEDD